MKLLKNHKEVVHYVQYRWVNCCNYFFPENMKNSQYIYKNSVNNEMKSLRIPYKDTIQT
jgi:hypothetical protein